MLMNEFQLTGFTLLVASFLFIPPVNADLRDEFKQEQTQKQKNYQKKLDYCSLGIELAQFKSDGFPLVYYYTRDNQVLEIIEYSDDRICYIKHFSALGVEREFVPHKGAIPYTQTCYIEDEKLVCYTKGPVMGITRITRKVIGVKK